MFGIFSQIQGWVKLKGDTDGTKIGNVSDSLKANVTASALPEGASTEATLAALNAKLNSLTVAPSNAALGLVVRQVPFELPTFSVVSPATQVGNNKSMLAIQNTGTSVVRIREIWIINDQNTSVTGVVGSFNVYRIASFTGGTALTPVSFDTIDTLPSGITAATGSTVATETSLLRTGNWSTDEWGTGTSDTESFDHAIQNTEPFWKQTPNGKALTIRQNQGLHVKFATNSTAGAFNIRLIFTVE
jgi:hypothetical protein